MLKEKIKAIIKFFFPVGTSYSEYSSLGFGVSFGCGVNVGRIPGIGSGFDLNPNGLKLLAKESFDGGYCLFVGSDNGEVYAGCRRFDTVETAIKHWDARTRIYKKYLTDGEMGEHHARRSLKRFNKFINALEKYKAETKQED